MKNTLKIFIIWFITGMLYFALEGLWRIPDGGYANIVMLFIGGLCGLAVGCINQFPKFFGMSIMSQSIIGTIITLTIELISGIIFNILLGMNIWDYSALPLNICGQICLPFALLWFFIMPFAIWLEDKIRYTLFKEGTDYSIRQIYFQFFTLQ